MISKEQRTEMVRYWWLKAQESLSSARREIDATESGNIAVLVSISITVILQLLLMAGILFSLLQKRFRAKSGNDA